MPLPRIAGGSARPVHPFGRIGSICMGEAKKKPVAERRKCDGLQSQMQRWEEECVAFLLAGRGRQHTIKIEIA